MACCFRVHGENLEIDSLLVEISIEPSNVWHKGEPRLKSKPDGRKTEHSGATFIASDAEMWEYDNQVEDAIEFLKENEEDIKTIVAFKGVECVRLDFGINLTESFVNSDYLPPPLLAMAGNLNIGIELSHYPPPKEDEPEETES